MTAGPRIGPQEAPLLFVCGLHRSGTSAVARLLASAPASRGLSATGVPEDEGQHLQRLLPTANAHGGPGVFAFDPGAHLTEASDLATSSVARRLLDAWTPYWQLHPEGSGAVLTLVEKSPPDLVRTRLLQALFPAARFLAVVRHPVVVAASTALWRPELAPGTLLRHWAHAYALYAEDAAVLRRTTLVRYEDLLGDPLRTTTLIATTLGIDARVSVDALETGHSETHLRRWQALQRRLRPDERAAAQEAAARYGYLLEPPYVLGASGLG
jgi:hypothetical protein